MTGRRRQQYHPRGLADRTARRLITSLSRIACATCRWPRTSTQEALLAALEHWPVTGVAGTSPARG